ncbi:unnamed protein product [Caretta caretta]
MKMEEYWWKTAKSLRWRQFYEKRLNEENVRKQREVCTGNKWTRPIAAVETRAALKMKKCGKAVGLDGVTMESFKVLGHEEVVIMNFFHLIFQTAKRPMWRKSTLASIFKHKGDMQEFNNY